MKPPVRQLARTHRVSGVGPILPRSLLLLFIALGIVAVPVCASASPEDDAALPVLPRVKLDVSFLRPPPMSKHVLRMLQEEANRIWSAYGVEIAWVGQPRTSAASTQVKPVTPRDRVQVLIMAHNPPDDLDQKLFYLASITRRRPGSPRGGPDALIVTTMERGLHLVRTALSGQNLKFSPLVEQRLVALLLGRAIAHEVGHYLLGEEHAPHGLMRPRFERGDVLFDGNCRFSLGPKELERLEIARTDHAGASYAHVETP